MTAPTPLSRVRLDLLRATLLAVAVAGVVVSIAMVVIGLPELNQTQSVLLELAMVPISVSLAAALGLLAQRARKPGRRSRLILAGTGVIGFAGATSMALAYLVGPRPLVSFGQALVLTALLVALLIQVRLQPPLRRVWFELPAEWDDSREDDEFDEPDQPAPDQR